MDLQENQIIADEFMDLIKNHAFDRYLFHDNVHIKRVDGTSPKWSVKAKGKWQGYVINYELISSQYSIPCEIYLGTIGDRGELTFADNKSRFLVTRIKKKIKKKTIIISTQYAFHRHLDTNKKGLLPYYKLIIDKAVHEEYWDEVYQKLNNNGYLVKDTNDKKTPKILSLGEISLDKDRDEQIGNLLEGLFAVTILKAHYKGNEKGYVFDFLK